MKEEWRNILGYKDFYAVSNLGRVRTFHGNRPRLMKTNVHLKYRYVTLSIYGNSERYKVSWLVLFAFVGPRPPGLDVSHIDGNSLNDRLDNLVYESRGENNKRRNFKGEKNPSHKLTEKQVRSIRKLKGTGIESIDVGNRFGITRHTVNCIWRRNLWGHI